ncbi:MAG: hypothetical protein K1X83_04075 [Oligoflexia bacterium]|nr:hypothetical protein [Oligoflexia bacterium]
MGQLEKIDRRSLEERAAQGLVAAIFDNREAAFESIKTFWSAMLGHRLASTPGIRDMTLDDFHREFTFNNLKTRAFEKVAGWEVQFTTRVSGPLSLEALEHLRGQSLRLKG